MRWSVLRSLELVLKARRENKLTLAGIWRRDLEGYSIWRKIFQEGKYKDCGVVQADALSVDPMASLEKFDEEAVSPLSRNTVTVIHLGEVNRIRKLPQDMKIVATHTDNPGVRN
ncbi:hypothetical protein C5167_004437 [Papaver somniferum]|uniref:Uncharacterized protein n=1 Tax=Papaver somniferum TaxID=3469 RepID=A0A4Y7JAN8_PAPSO|nr:hypothetical protein C5167_004437 [Papaver somniferum]